MELNKIYNEDCLEGMKKIKEESLDSIFTDPPYNIARDNNFETMGRASIDFGEWDKEFDIVGWIDTAVSKLKKGGNIVIFTDWKALTLIVEKLKATNCSIKDMIRVEKSNPMPRNRERRFVTDYEVAIWSVKSGGDWTFNRLSENYERPLIKATVTPLSEKQNINHPTQKNIYVMEWIVKRLSKVGDVILDPFMGSGTTAIACMNTERNFIGFELDKTYYEKSLERIKNHTTQTEMFDF